MDISTGLIAKGTAGLATAAAATSGVIYRDNVVNFLKTGSFVIQTPQVENPTVNEATKKASLGLGEIDGCELPGENEAHKDCSGLDGSKLNSINFLEKGSKSLTIASGTVNLRIEKVTEDSAFPKGLKFIFTTTSDVNTNGTAQKTIMKANTNPEFKIKEEGGKWFLERAWTVNELGKKVGLNCLNETTTNCTFGETANIYEDSSKWIVGAGVSGTDVNVTVAKDQDNYNQGYKFTISGTNISVTGNTSQSSESTVTQLDATASYEIKEQAVNGVKNWFLSKKTNASGG